jgi:hypothetical protein
VIAVTTPGSGKGKLSHKGSSCRQVESYFHRRAVDSIIAELVAEWGALHAHRAARHTPAFALPTAVAGGLVESETLRQLYQ